MAWPESPGSSSVRRLTCIALVTLSLVSTVCADEPAPKLTPEQIAQIAVSSVVLIRSPTGLGSGFVATADGKVVTNFHVIEDATQGTPLAAHLTPVPRRNIPRYPPSILNACPAPQLQTIVSAISRAIEVGAPLYNQGNFEACYRIYEGAALEVQQTVQQCQGPKQALVQGIDNAKKLAGWSGKAWAVRDTFDGLLTVAAPTTADRSHAAAVMRHIPLVPLSVIDECPTEDMTSIAESISAAINSGAPLYNSGNAEACYRIYEGAVSGIDRKFGSCPATHRVLQEGIHNADQVTDWSAKAWALRDSFDGLLNAIATHSAGAR